MLLSLYVENFDPVFKVLHMPTLKQDIKDASADIENIAGGKNFEALMFALYYAGATALPPEKCLYLFQEEKESMLNRYRYGVEIAFSNADLFTSADMVTLQALVIFLVIFPCCLTIQSATRSIFESTPETHRNPSAKRNLDRFAFAVTTTRSSLGHSLRLPYGLHSLLAYIARVQRTPSLHSCERCAGDYGGRSVSWIFMQPKIVDQIQ